MKSLLVLLGFVSLSFGSSEWHSNQVKKPACCMPKNMQMTFLGEVLFDYAGAEFPFRQLYSIYATGDGITGLKYFDRATGKVQRRIVIDYKKQVAYLISSGDGGCVQQAFKEPQSDGCLREGARLVGDYRIGYGLDSIDGFTYQTTDPATNLKEEMSVTKNCIPIHWVKTFTDGLGKAYLNGGIVDPKLKVTEKDIFDVPGSCSKAEAGNSEFKNLLHTIPSFMLKNVD